MNFCEITSPELPGAVFHGYDALRQHAAKRKQYETAVQAFEQDCDTEALSDALVRLGYDPETAAVHVAAPGWRIPERFF